MKKPDEEKLLIRITQLEEIVLELSDRIRQISEELIEMKNEKIHQQQPNADLLSYGRLLIQIVKPGKHSLALYYAEARV